MKLYKLNDFKKGWFFGHFDPTIIDSKDVEVGIKHYVAGDREPKHMHKIATEITVIVRGLVRMNENYYSSGDIIMIEPGELTDFEAIEDTTTCVVKTPSVSNDKYVL